MKRIKDFIEFFGKRNFITVCIIFAIGILFFGVRYRYEEDLHEMYSNSRQKICDERFGAYINGNRYDVEFDINMQVTQGELYFRIYLEDKDGKDLKTVYEETLVAPYDEKLTVKAGDTKEGWYRIEASGSNVGYRGEVGIRYKTTAYYNLIDVMGLGESIGALKKRREAHEESTKNSK